MDPEDFRHGQVPLEQRHREREEEEVTPPVAIREAERGLYALSAVREREDRQIADRTPHSDRDPQEDGPGAFVHLVAIERLADIAQVRTTRRVVERYGVDRKEQPEERKADDDTFCGVAGHRCSLRVAF